MRLKDIDNFPLLPNKLDGDESEYEKGYHDATANLNALPTIDPESLRPTGEWVTMTYWKKRRGHHVQYVVKKCSSCNFRVKARWKNNYCPNCGAKMKEGT